MSDDESDQERREWVKILTVEIAGRLHRVMAKSLQRLIRFRVSSLGYEPTR